MVNATMSNNKKILALSALLIFCAWPLFAADASDGSSVTLPDKGDWYTVGPSTPIPAYVLRLPDDYNFFGTYDLVMDMANSIHARFRSLSGRKIRFYIGGHGWNSRAEYVVPNAQDLGYYAGADIALVLDFPEFRGAMATIAWPEASQSASQKTATAVAAINALNNAEVWAMRGESGMAESIVKMMEFAPEYADMLKVKTYVILDSYPFSDFPFVPHKVPAQFLKQIGGKMYIHYTKFGHWSNPLSGDPEKLVNICVAPGGEAVPHSNYWLNPQSRELLRMEIAGRPLSEVNDYLNKIGKCGKIPDAAAILSDIRW